MKALYKFALSVAVLAPAVLTTSCIEETTPTDGLTSEMLSSSPKATEALLWEMAAIYNNYGTLTSNAYDWGYGSIMHMRDVMTEDMPIASSNYDWYTSWETANYLGEQYLNCQYVWNYHWKIVQTCNNVFAATGYENPDETIMAYIGVASAFRAAIYLDLARCYEFLPNNVTSPITAKGNNVTGYTVPIVTEQTSEEAAKDNPRVTREEMAKFILSDLDRAEANIGKAARLGNTMPNLAVVYGLKARCYMWLGQNVDDTENLAMYAKAAEYARKAITESGCTPLSKEEWINPSSGFNSYNHSWMWCMTTVKEDRVVTSGILNWTSWMSLETTFGYAAAGPYLQIYKATYDKIANTDFRKLSWKAPDNSPIYDQVVFNEGFEDKIVTYGSVKFRPSQGDTNSYLVACVGDIPLMRVEEMYLIEAEAKAHSNPAEGRDLLVSFMTQYRDPSYSFNKTAKDQVVEEIFFQKRIELWGEGQVFYDFKRLGTSIDRRKSGTNYYEDAQLVSEGRAGWLNWVMVQTEGNSNKGVVGWNNPSFDGLYPGAK